jgi:hypothetical protein
MAHAIIRDRNGRRYEVEFAENAMSLAIHLGEENVEIVLESLGDLMPQSERRMALLSLPRAAFAEALGRSARLSAKNTRSARKPL